MFPTEIIREIWDRIHIDQKFINRQVCKTFLDWFNESVDFEEEIKLIGEHIIKLKNNTIYINGKPFNSLRNAEFIFDNMDLAFGHYEPSMLCFNHKNIGYLIYRNGKITKLGYPNMGEYYYLPGLILCHDCPEFKMPVSGTVKIQDEFAIIYYNLKISIIFIPENLVLKSFNVPCEPDDFSIVCMDAVSSEMKTKCRYKGIIAMNILLGNTVISKIICA